MFRRLAASRAYVSLIRSWMSSSSKGGRWALQHPEDVQRNLRNFWLDGLFANASDAIILTYLTLYLLSLGATNAQIGLLSSLGSLTATILLLPGAWLAERFGRRKWQTAIFGGVLGRGMVLLLVLAPFVYHDQRLVYAAIGLAVLREGFGNMSLPSWVSLTGDLVPVAWRGRYFASRNIIMGIAGMTTTLIAGAVITHMTQPAGYQTMLAVAFALGMVSTFFFTRLVEPKTVRSTMQVFRPLDLWNTLFSSRQFLMFAFAAAVWNFSLNIAGPFFSVYMVKGLLFNAATIGLLSIVSTLAGLPAQRLVGPLVDKLGPRRVMSLTGFLIPIMPLAWIIVSEPWHIAVLNAASGMLWAGFSLASFNMLLTMGPPERMARVTAIYQVVVAVSLGLGAAVGSFVVTHWSFAGVFLLSALGRWVAAGLFNWLVPKEADAAPA